MRKQALEEQRARGGRYVVTEEKSWATGRLLCAEAEREGQLMPALFSGAEAAHQTGLIY